MLSDGDDMSKTKLAYVADHPNIKKMLDLLAYTEGTDSLHSYNTLVGGKRIEDLSDHPNVVGVKTKDGPSTAFGRYQITNSTWRNLRKKYNFNDFSPRTQDLAAIALLSEAGALDHLIEGDFKKAINKSKDIWVSLPGSNTKNQPEKSWKEIENFLNKAEPKTRFMGGNENVGRVNRDSSAPPISSFQQAIAKFSNIKKAYESGRMSPEEEAEFENDIESGKISLPGFRIKDRSSVPAPSGVLNAYKSNQMSRQEKIEFENDVKSGLVKVPKGFIIENTEPLSVFGHIKEAITGDDRKTSESEKSEDWSKMPELNDYSSIKGWKTNVGTFMAGSDEIAKIIKENNPNVEIKQDSKGNYLFKSGIDGKWYALKPGFRSSDIPRALGSILAFTPAGRAKTLLGSAAAAAATQAVVEGSQAASGGDFNPSQVLDAGVVGAASPVIINTLNKAISPLTSIIKPNAQKILKNNVEKPDLITSSDLASTARIAAEGGLNSNAAAKSLASQVPIDKKTISAAERLGISEYLQPDHVTTNQIYKELAQAIKSIPGSETRAAEVEGLEQIAKRADDLIEELGGTRDISSLSNSIRSEMQKVQQQLENEATRLYDELKIKINPRAEVSTPNILSFIGKRTEELGGLSNITSMERTIRRKLSNNPTYGLLDDVRRELTAARIKGKGPFKDADTGLIKKLEAELKKDQLNVVNQYGVADIFQNANKVVAIRKSLEDDMISLFGKEINNSMAYQLESSIKSLPKGDPDKLINLIKAVPSDMRQQVVASGLATAFGKNARNNQINFSSYIKWYENLLKNKKSYLAIMSNLPPGSRKQLSDLYRVSKGISSSTKERINTGRLLSLQQQLYGSDGLIYDFYQIAKRSSLGLAAEAVTTPLGVPGSGVAAGIASALTRGKTSSLKAVDALIGSPEFLNMVKSIGTSSQKQEIKKFALSKKFSNFLKEVKNPMNLSQREKYLISVIQAQKEYKYGY